MDGKQILAAFRQYHTPNYVPHPINLVDGAGSILRDSEGKEYIDLAGGIAVSALGHRHPALIQAAHQAVDGIWHLSNYWTNESALRLAEALCKATFCEKVFFCNSGAEANEAALKLARKYSYDSHQGTKHKIVACSNSFHGRTLFTATVTGQSKYSEAFAPLPGGICHIPFNDIEALERELDGSCCAFIVEPVQGEGGVIPIDPAFAHRARELCDAHQALLVFDEIQSGLGRTGHIYAYQKLQVVPDILTSAKALGCGLPLGAMLTSTAIAEHLTVGSHGTTAGGNPFVTRVALAGFNHITHPELLAAVRSSGVLALDALNSIGERLGCFSQVRGAGLLIGCQWAEVWKPLCNAIIQQAIAEGVLVLVAAGGAVLRLAPALNIDPNLLKKGIDRLEHAIHTIGTQEGVI